jgi:thiamine-phosphate pyrophosphorylase
MLPELTPAVARAVAAAQQLARARGDSSVRPRDLLHGLLQEEEGRATVLLDRLGVSVAAVRAGDLGASATGGAPAADAPGSPLSPLAQAALSRAAELAVDLTAERTVASESLLLALLQEDAELRRSLEDLGLSMERLEAELFAAKGPPLHLDEPLVLDDATERIDIARILDAAANRAREALRVVEDYCRFVLDDAFLSRQSKQLRHDLAESLNVLPPNVLMEARDTLGDVGTSISTGREQTRHSLKEVVQVNLKRLQEALRSLEECAKLSRPNSGRALEQLRYHAYTLERAIHLGSNARERLADAKLYVLLTGSQCAAALDWTIQQAAEGGASIFQLREKALNDRELLARARDVRRWTRQAGALFIVNDRPDIARLVEADGVHLGQDDLPVREARRILGPDALIGVSTHTLDQLHKAILDGASNVGVGPTFPSGTKEFVEFPGLDFVRQALAETSLPAFVIGGVNVNSIATAVAVGAKRVAVSQAICQAEEPRTLAASLIRALDRIVG